MQQDSQFDRRSAAIDAPAVEKAHGARSRLGSALALLRDKVVKPLGGRARTASAVVSRERLREIIERDRALLASEPSMDDEDWLAEARAMAALATDADLSTAARARIVDDLGPSRLAEIERWIAEQIADLPTTSSTPVTIDNGGESEAEAEGAAGADDRIRTRTMARLLAKQGYRERALAIYEELIVRRPDDEVLQAEWHALRSS